MTTVVVICITKFLGFLHMHQALFSGNSTLRCNKVFEAALKAAVLLSPAIKKLTQLVSDEIHQLYVLS